MGCGTWPIEPLAKGVSSKWGKRLSKEAPKDRSTSWRVQPGVITTGRGKYTGVIATGRGATVHPRLARVPSTYRHASTQYLPCEGPCGQAALRLRYVRYAGGWYVACTYPLRRRRGARVSWASNQSHGREPCW